MVCIKRTLPTFLLVIGLDFYSHFSSHRDSQHSCCYLDESIWPPLDKYRLYCWKCSLPRSSKAHTASDGRWNEKTANYTRKPL